MNDYVLIEYSNSTDLGDIVYHNTFENRVYLDADVSKPEYELIEEGEDNGDGEFTATFQKWQKKYTIEFYAQEFLVDALTLMALHDQITITLKNGEASNVKDIEIDPKWDSDIECWALVTIKFATEYVVKRGCDENFDYGCPEAVVTCDSEYDADDGAGGQDEWESTPNSNEKAFFYEGLEAGDSVYTGSPLGFYQGINGEWVLIAMENGQVGIVEDLVTAGTCVYLIKSGTNFYRIPYIRAATDQGGGDVKISAYAVGMENTFYQVQYENLGVWTDLGDPQLASAFENGFVVSPGAGNWDFRIKWYTHSCDFGYSNEANETVT